VKITNLPGNYGVYKLVREWPERTAKFMDFFVYLAAKQTFENIQGKIPGGDEWKAYKRSLVLARVMGTAVLEPAYVIKAKLKGGGGGRAKQKEPAKEVVYVRPTKRSRKKDKAVAVLEKYGPWTWDTLPFAPSKRHAVLVTRKVREREMMKISEQRKKDKNKWQKALNAVGARLRKRSLAHTNVPRKAKVVPDIAFEALRLEFGMGGGKSKSHWRPGIQSFLNSGLKGIMARKDIRQAFLDPAFGGWKSWSPGTEATSNPKEAKSFVPFQDKLGI